MAVKKGREKRQFNAYLPTGYGKTCCSMLAYGSLRGDARVNRALVIVPSVQQRDDYIEDLSKVCRNLGLTISGHDKCGEIRAIRRCQIGDAEIVVTTIQHINSDFENQGRKNFNDGYYSRLLRDGQWLIIADEHHHYQEDKAWGEALNSLKFAVRLGLSATPLSSKGEPSVIGCDYDVLITIQEAFEEQAIRRIRGHILNHHVDITIGDDEEVVKLTTEDIRNDLLKNEDISAWEVRRKIRYCSEFLSDMLGAAVATLNMKLLAHPGQHQMLVFAMSCRHAKHISEMLNTVYGFGGEKFSDWIGTGPDGRTNNENSEILRQYKNNAFSCLVQVDKAGEGFDNARSSVLCFLNNGTSKTNKSRQQFGRGFRRNYAISIFEDDLCDIFVSSDSDLVPLVRDLEWETRPSKKEWEDDDDLEIERDKDYFFPIPDLITVRTSLHFTEIVEPFGSPKEAAERLREEAPGAFAHVGDSHLEALIERVMYRKRQELERKAEEETIEMMKEQVRVATASLAQFAAKVFYGKEIPNGAIGQAMKSINTRWKRENLSHGEMTKAEFAKKNKWLQNISKAIKEQRSIDGYRWILS